MTFIASNVLPLLELLFAPQRTARRMPDDAPLWPALCVAVLSYVPVGVRITMNEGWPANAAYLTGILCCIACNVLAYAIIARLLAPRGESSIRVRPFAVVSLYATCFVAGWAIVEPPMLFSARDATFFWPFAGNVLREARKFESLTFLGCSAIYYWWWGVLAVFAGLRIRAKYRGWLFVVVPPISTLVATRAAYWMYDALGF